ncbi:MAG: hypothetical protein O7E51_09790, partial [Acidobacteria bacterium]|nr:hypothetical protein [Acidobacteriota bacterium]
DSRNAAGRNPRCGATRLRRLTAQAGGLTPNNMEGGSWKSLPLFVLQGLPVGQGAFVWYNSVEG